MVHRGLQRPPASGVNFDGETWRQLFKGLYQKDNIGMLTSIGKKIILFFVSAGMAGVGFWVFNASREKRQIASVQPSETAIQASPNNNGTDTAASDGSSTSSVEEQGRPASENSSSSQAVEGNERFVVALNSGTIDQTADSLLEQGFIKDKAVFIKAFGEEGGMIDPGGYKLSKDMSAAQIAKVLRNKPYMKWIVIPEGLRKEEIAELLANALGWTAGQKEKWINTYTAMEYDYIEGVYFPDTYLIPVNEEPLDTAQRLQAKFNEKFAVFLPKFNSQNIKWTTGLTFASIVQREAADASDMPLIAGILWNRLDQNMALNVDATLQYVRGNTGKGWWASIGVADKQTDSPYNTYLNKGLPPHPICNPGITAIEAILDPVQTDCLYYLHDADRVIHCAKTYEEHLENIEKYLKTAD